MADPLETLLVNPESVAREELAEGLEPFIRFDRGGGLWPTERFEDLSSRQKVATLLLALKAQELLGLREAEGASPAELVQLSAMPQGTVRPSLADLLKMKLAVKSESVYAVAGPAVRRALKFVTEARR